MSVQFFLGQANQSCVNLVNHAQLANTAICVFLMKLVLTGSVNCVILVNSKILSVSGILSANHAQLEHFQIPEVKIALYAQMESIQSKGHPFALIVLLVLMGRLKILNGRSGILPIRDALFVQMDIIQVQDNQNVSLVLRESRAREMTTLGPSVKTRRVPARFATMDIFLHLGQLTAPYALEGNTESVPTLIGLYGVANLMDARSAQPANFQRTILQPNVKTVR
jgi:hypothetical protein